VKAVRMSHRQLRDRMAVLRGMLEEEFPTTRQLDERTVTFDFAAGPIPFTCYCEINLQAHAYIVRAVFSLPFHKGQRTKVSEFLHRVNYPLPVGNWAINLDNGEVRWKSGLFFGNDKLTDELIYEAIGSSMHFIRQHAPGLIKLSLGRSLGEALRALGKDLGEGIIGQSSGRREPAPRRAGPGNSSRKGKARGHRGNT